MKTDPLQSPRRRQRLAALAAGALILTLLRPGLFAIRTAAAEEAVVHNFETEASYASRPGDPESLARTLALFRAKRMAAEQAADRFAGQRLIQFVTRDKNEQICLVADSLKADLLWDRWEPGGDSRTYTVRVKARVHLSDFIDAQLADLTLEREEASEDYRDEMEPVIPVLLKPGHALAKAYRLIDNKELRLAIIYLDRLTRRYPNWFEAYEVKAVALRLEHQESAMREALRRACALGSSAACREVE